MELIQALYEHMLPGLSTHMVFEVLKVFLTKAADKSIEDLYVDAIKEQARLLETAWIPKYGSKLVLKPPIIHALLHRTLQEEPCRSALRAQTRADFVGRAAQACVSSVDAPITIENRTLSDDDYRLLITMLIQSSLTLWDQQIATNETAFRAALLSEAKRTGEDTQRLGDSIASIVNEIRALRQRLSTSAVVDPVISAIAIKERLFNAQRLDLRRTHRELQRLKGLRSSAEVGSTGRPQLSDAIPQKAHNVPQSKTLYVSRDAHFERVVAALDLKNRGWGVAVDGLGGVGKTTLATEVSHYLTKSPEFAKVIWTAAKAGRNRSAQESTFADLAGLIDLLLRAFGSPTYLFDELSNAEKQAHLIEILKVAPCLVILDNLETIEDYDEIAAFLAITPTHTKTLTTTRRRHLGHGETRVHLPPMTLEETRQFAAKFAQTERIDISDRIIDEIFGCVGGLPLAIQWCIGHLRQSPGGVQRFLSRLKLLRSTGSVDDDERHVLEYCFRETYATLSEDARRAMQVMAVISSPLTADAVSGAIRAKVPQWERLVEELEAFSLIRFESIANEEQERIEILPFTRMFLRAEMTRAQGQDALDKIARDFAAYCSELKPDVVVAFTPEYEPIRLPRGATALDFAYHVHTALGHSFGSAVVNGVAVNMHHELSGGERVHIEAGQPGPVDESWLTRVHSKKAKQSIRARIRRLMDDRVGELPTRTATLVSQGDALALRCKADEARHRYERAVEIDPKDTVALVRLGNSLCMAGEAEQASAVYRRALFLNPRNGFAVAGQAALEYKRGDWEKAGSLYEVALALQPRYVNALLGMGRANCAMREYSKAQGALERARRECQSRRSRVPIELISMAAAAGCGDFSLAAASLADAWTEVKKFHRSEWCGSQMLYYYSLVLACAGSAGYEEFLERAIERSAEPGVILVILADLHVLSGLSFEELSRAVGIKDQGASCGEGIRRIRGRLEEVRNVNYHSWAPP